MQNKMDAHKSKVKGLFAQEDELIEPAKNPKPKQKPNSKPSAKKTPVAKEPGPDEAPKFLNTKQAQRGILHCEIGPELFERAALFAYDTQSPVKDMTDLARKCLVAFLDKEEPALQRFKQLYEKSRE